MCSSEPGVETRPSTGSAPPDGPSIAPAEDEQVAGDRSAGRKRDVAAPDDHVARNARRDPHVREHGDHASRQRLRHDDVAAHRGDGARQRGRAAAEGGVGREARSGTARPERLIGGGHAGEDAEEAETDRREQHERRDAQRPVLAQALRERLEAGRSQGREVGAAAREPLRARRERAGPRRPPRARPVRPPSGPGRRAARGPCRPGPPSAGPGRSRGRKFGAPGSRRHAGG